MHLLVHQHAQIIRIIPLDDVTAYESEFERVYGPLTCLDDRRQLFYNVSDLMDRLVTDIGFKKFKGCGKLEVTASTLYKIPLKAPPDFFKATFLPWLTDKIAEYIEDEDGDGDHINLDNMMSPPFDVKRFVDVQYEEVATKYSLVGCQKDDYAAYVVKDDHLKALFMAYAKNNKAKFCPSYEDYTCMCYKLSDGHFVPCVLKDESLKRYKCFKTVGDRYYPCVSEDERYTIYKCCKDDDGKYVPCVEGEDIPEIVYECAKDVSGEYILVSVTVNDNDTKDPVKIGNVTFGRGITLSKDALTNRDIEAIVEHLGVKSSFDNAMREYVLHLDYTADNEIVGYYEGFATLEEAFSGILLCAPIFAGTPKSLTAIDTRMCAEVEFDDKFPFSKKKDDVDDADDAKDYNFYMDIMTYKIRCFDFEVKHLTEFKKLGAAQFETSAVKRILDLFMTNDTDRDTVKELTALAKMMASFFPEVKNDSESGGAKKQDADDAKEKEKEKGNDDKQDDIFNVGKFTRVPRRNANQQLRADPPNPFTQVSIWNQATIRNDPYCRTFELKSTREILNDNPYGTTQDTPLSPLPHDPKTMQNRRF